MSTCANCGFENKAGAETCINCLADLRWAKNNLGSFTGTPQETITIGRAERKKRGVVADQDVSDFLEGHGGEGETREEGIHKEKTTGPKRGFPKTLGAITFALVFLGLLAAAYFYLIPSLQISQVAGNWCLQIEQAEATGDSRKDWSIKAPIPFTVDEQGNLKGTGKYTFTPRRQDGDYANASGTLEISGLYQPMKDRFEIKLAEFALLTQDHTVNTTDEWKRDMTELQLGKISFSYFWRAIDIQASDGAHLGQTPGSIVTQGWSVTVNRGSCR